MRKGSLVIWDLQGVIPKKLIENRGKKMGLHFFIVSPPLRVLVLVCWGGYKGERSSHQCRLEAKVGKDLQDPPRPTPTHPTMSPNATSLEHLLAQRSHHIRPCVCVLQLAGWPRGEQAEDRRALQVDGRRRQLQLEVHLPLRLSPCRADVLRCKEGECLCADVCAFSGLICLTKCKPVANRLLFV